MHRDFLRYCVAPQTPSGRASVAVYVSTRGRPENIVRVLAEPALQHCDVFLLPSSDCDIPKMELSSSVGILDWRGTCHHDPASSPSEFDWDLPCKRNAALLHARATGRHAALLLDDDIREIDPRIVTCAGELLSDLVLVGLIPESFPDTSVQGHLERALGRREEVFASGSCLLVRTDYDSRFLHVYNEDWLFMLPAIRSRSIGWMGNVYHMPYDPWQRLSVLSFQMFGDVLAETVFDAVANRRIRLLSAHSHWEECVEEWRRGLRIAVRDFRTLGLLDAPLCGQVCDTFVEVMDSLDSTALHTYFSANVMDLLGRRAHDGGRWGAES